MTKVCKNSFNGKLKLYQCIGVCVCVCVCVCVFFKLEGSNGVHVALIINDVRVQGYQKF